MEPTRTGADGFDPNASPIAMGYAASFIAPDLPGTGPRYPDWIILARRAFISDRHNETTVVAGQTSDGNPVQVSLFAADPPAVSHLRVHCPGRDDDEFSYNPAVIFSRDDLTLFDVCFDCGVSDYFIYRAHPKNPSIVRIPDPEPYTSGLFNTGIVRCGADHFAVAALYWDYVHDRFKLTVFSSRTGVWMTRVVPLEPRLVFRFSPTKVIPMKGSILGWVDLWRGILFCDILSDDPKLHYIPMPTPMPGNVDLQHKGEPAFFRDVIGCGEVIKLVEVEYFDNDDDDDEDDEPVDTGMYDPDDKWIVVTRSRKLDSTERGREHEVSSEDVTVSEDFRGWSDLLPDKVCVNGKPSLKKIAVGLPTLCELNSVVYLMCKSASQDNKGWVLAVDTKSKKMESVARFSAVSFPGFMTAYYPSSFSKHFNDNTTEIELKSPTTFEVTAEDTKHDGLASTDTSYSSLDD